MISGTVLIATVAIFFAVPLATGVALYISEYAPRRIRRGLINLVDLMAAVPSVVFGLWGFYLLSEQIIPLARFLARYLGWLPLLGIHDADPGSPFEDLTIYKSQVGRNRTPGQPGPVPDLHRQPERGQRRDPTRHSNRVTTGVNSLDPAIVVIAPSRHRHVALGLSCMVRSPSIECTTPGPWNLVKVSRNPVWQRIA